MISVCMATYNGEAYIREQLDSILEQISNSDEIIISDDGSLDSTIEIIKEYQKTNKNIKLLNGPREGVINNFENALYSSKGDVIFLTDQDDVWREGKVKRILKVFENPNILLALHDAHIIDKDGTIIENSFFEHRNSKPGFLNNIIKNSYLGCCMAFKRSLLDICLPFPPKIEMHDWWIGLLGEKIGEVSFIEEKYLNYRRHGNNVSSFHHHPLKKMIFNRLYLIKEVIIRIKKEQ